MEVANVIACAASGEDNPDDIFIYLYPREHVRDIRLYGTNTVNINEENYNKYIRAPATPEPIFNGYLLKFIRNTTIEKWVIVSFVENGVIQVSNPIRIQQQAAPTSYNDKITIDQSVSKMPKFC